MYIACYCNFSMENTPYKTACTNVLPDDERTMFKTCRRQEELNCNLNSEKFAFC